MDRITFIMSVLNTRKSWIKRAVDSVLNQTSDNWELIIVDDGSNKETADYLDEIGKMENRIRVHHQEKQGLSVARNYGMDNATGRWVTFIDADDWIEETYVEEILNQLKSRPDIEMISFGHDDIWPDRIVKHLWGDEELHVFSVSDKDGMLMSLLQQPEELQAYPMYFGAQWKFVYSLEFLNKYEIRNIPGLYKAQDSVFNLYAVNYATKMIYYNKTLYHYFHNSESVTGGGFNRDLDRYKRLILSYRGFLKETGRLEESKFMQAYKNNAILQFEAILRVHFFHPDNPDSKKINIDRMNKLLNDTPYLELRKEMNRNGLSLYKSLLFIAMKSNNYNLILFIYKLKKQ